MATNSFDFLFPLEKHEVRIESRITFPIPIFVRYFLYCKSQIMAPWGRFRLTLTFVQIVSSYQFKDWATGFLQKQRKTKSEEMREICSNFVRKPTIT